MFEIFGDTLPLPAKFFIAFAVVLALIGITAWLVRRFGANRLGGAAARGRQPRLAVIDAAPVDGRRRLVLIRRDNVEHLLMIGGTTDVVVETNIVRGAASTREPGMRESAVREPAPRETSVREPAVREPVVRDSARSAPPVDTGWPLQPASDPAPVIPTRPSRATEEPWTPPEPGARARPSDSNSLANMAADLSAKFSQPEVAPPVTVRAEPPIVRPSPPPVAPQAPAYVAPEPVAVAPQADHNLAEMAQQLEAALRRAPAPEARPPVTDALAAAPKSPVPTRDYKLRLDPKFESKLEPKPEPKLEARAEPKFDVAPEPRIEPRVAAPAASSDKSVFDNLEEEMASLLGRPPGKT